MPPAKSNKLGGSGLERTGTARLLVVSPLGSTPGVKALATIELGTPLPPSCPDAEICGTLDDAPPPFP